VSPRVCAWAASAKSWLIRRRSRTCLYLSTILNLYVQNNANGVKRAAVRSSVPIPAIFGSSVAKTYLQQHVQSQFALLGQLLAGFDRELLSAF